MPTHRREIAVNVAARISEPFLRSGETIADPVPPGFPSRNRAANRHARTCASASVSRLAGSRERRRSERLCGGESSRLRQPQANQREHRGGPASVPRFGHRCGVQTFGSQILRCGSDADRNRLNIALANTRCFGGWKASAFEQQERALKLLAITFGGDPACTDCNRVLRLPGYLNQKYDPAHLVGVEYASDSTSYPRDFRLAIPTLKGDLIRGGIRSGKPTGKHSNSEQDWTWILQELARGKDPVKLTRTLAERRSDKPNPLYYAQRTVDVASAWLWLMKGFPIADVVTMLQVRRCFEIPKEFGPARAHEIAFTAQRMIARKKIA